MINKQDILDRAAEWQLRPDVVEKDYVLGWLLAGVTAHPETRSYWIFKGGTCIKKCYFETYRFSEDLDFSLLADAPYTEEAIRENLQTVARITAEMSGLEVPIDQIALRPSQNRQSQLTYQGRIYYRGPLGARNLSRVIFDITRQETVVDGTVQLPVFHPYDDAPPDLILVSTYSLNELVAEKLRALYERTRPRDLYDVIYLLENRIDKLDLNRVREVFRQKCVAKGIETPTIASLMEKVTSDAELKSEWANMLSHQLPSLPNVDDFISRLPSLITWIEQPGFVPMESRLTPAAAPSQDEIPLAPAGIRFWGGGLPLETIRFAGANRLLLEFNYHGKHRVVEPYSIRRAQSTGNILLYAYEVSAAHVKAFKVPEMVNVHPTHQSFVPRYQIELTPGSSYIPSVSSRPSSGYSSRTSQSRSRTQHGPTYVVECTYCNRRFRRSTYDTSLNAHKTPDGWPCSGRTGYLVDTIY